MHKNPPANTEAETCLLSSIIFEGETRRTLDICLKAGLKPEAFAVVLHRNMWAAMLALAQDNVIIDEISLCGAMEKAGTLGIDTVKLVAKIATKVEFTGNSTAWLEIVLERYHRRRMVAIAMDAMNRAQDPTQSIDELAVEVERSLFSVRQSIDGGPNRETLGPTVEKLRQEAVDWESGKAQEDLSAHSVTWGLRSLDKAFTPIRACDGDLLIVILGMSSHGKSAYTRFLVAKNLVAGKRCVVFSLETTKRQFVARVAGMYAMFDVSEFRREREKPGLGGLIDSIRASVPDPIRQTNEINALQHNFSCYRSWLKYLGEKADENLHCYDTAHSLEQIVTTLRTLHRSKPLDLAVVDYLQLVRASELRRGRRGDEILAEVTSAFKVLAAELCIPIFLVSSITDKETDKTPDFTAARGSQDIAYGADRAIIVFRPKEDSIGENQDARRANGNAPVDLRIKQAKSRDLPIWEQKVLFVGRYTLFRDIPDPSVRGRPDGVKNGEGNGRLGIFPPGSHPPTASSPSPAPVEMRNT